MTLEQALMEFREAIRKSKEISSWADKELKNLSHVPSLLDRPVGGATKDNRTWPLDMDLFDENDGETKAERRRWAAADAFDMREGK